MKNLIIYLLIAFLVTGGLTSLTAQEAEKLFQQGMMKEEAERNLTEAIEIYSQLAEDASVDREIRANAFLRIGICNEKLGTENALSAYHKISFECSDQVDIVSIYLNSFIKMLGFTVLSFDIRAEKCLRSSCKDVKNNA